MWHYHVRATRLEKKNLLFVFCYDLMSIIFMGLQLKEEQILFAYCLLSLMFMCWSKEFVSAP